MGDSPMTAPRRAGATGAMRPEKWGNTTRPSLPGEPSAAAAASLRVGGVFDRHVAEDLAADPLDHLAGPSHVRKGVPASRQRGAHRHQGAVARVGHKRRQTDAEHGGRSGDVERLGGRVHAGAQRAGRRVAAAGGDGCSGEKAEVWRGLRAELSDDAGALHNGG